MIIPIEAEKIKIIYQIQVKRWGRWLDFGYPFSDEDKIEQIRENAKSTYEGLDCPIQLVKKITEYFLLREDDES